ncbi:MAG: DUF3618 domain-containing protein [Geodermatophilaceae bacterium]|nr:DUF3618 domain-containing protein [Geodermatophilaceae bacterium]
MTSSDPEVIREQIEQTRRNLSYDVDALNEKANPARVVDRKVSAAKGSVTGLKDKVFGSAQDSTASASSTASSAAGSVQDAASSAAHSVQNAPEAMQRGTQGNPVAAGLIAFGVGWLVSSLLPTSEKEKQLAAQAESVLKEHSQPLIDQAKQAAQDAGEALKPAAQQAVESVKGTAQDAAQTVTEHGRSAAQDVQDQAQQSRQNVQGQASS